MTPEIITVEADKFTDVAGNPNPTSNILTIPIHTTFTCSSMKKYIQCEFYSGILTTASFIHHYSYTIHR